MEFNDKCVILMRCREARSGKCSEKYSETHIPSGCRINYKNKLIIFVLCPLFSAFLNQFSYSFFFLIEQPYHGPVSNQGASMCLVAALKLSVPCVHDTVSEMQSPKHSEVCAFLPAYVHFHSTYKLSRHDSQSRHKYE